jgi:hypothetical protein
MRFLRETAVGSGLLNLYHAALCASREKRSGEKRSGPILFLRSGAMVAVCCNV